jgi:hypothetical protein
MESSLVLFASGTVTQREERDAQLTVLPAPPRPAHLRHNAGELQPAIANASYAVPQIEPR